MRTLRKNGAAASPGAYPPARYVEHDVAKIHEIIELFNFATVVSVDAGEPVVTHVPVTLDRTRGPHGVIFGHMDRRNPHLALLAGRRTTLLFHGPNSYITPHALAIDALPTWNSVNVHVRGTGRLLDDRRELLSGLCGISEKSDPGPGAYRIDPDDPRIDLFIDHVVGFEIEIDELVGRFKVSQELDAENRLLTAREMARTARRDRAGLLADIFNLERWT